MPTTFKVAYLGTFASIDPTEGNTVAENAGALVGMTFGAPGSPLRANFVTFSPGSYGGGNATAYDQNNSASNDTFRINGGPLQTFDASVIYDATITYADGTTATITAVVFQDTAGRTYWAPEFSPNADQTAMEAKAIRSLTLDSLAGSNYAGMNALRESWNFVPCFAAGTRILTPDGEVPVERLREGDRVLSRDGEALTVRWIGRREVTAVGRHAPVRIAPGALGGGLPRRALFLSRQHRLPVGGPEVVRLFGAREVLVPAFALAGLPGIAERPTGRPIAYLHLLTDRHAILLAEGAAAESFLPGPMARAGLGPQVLAEIEAGAPGVLARAASPCLPLAAGRRLRQLVRAMTARPGPLRVSLRTEPV